MACTLRFVGRDSGGVKNLLYVTDTTNTGMVGYIITLNGNTIYSDGITAPHAAGSTISLSAPNTDGVITNGTYHVYQRIIGESAYENDFVLNYTIPANTLSLTIDGYSSTVVCRDSTLYTGLTVSNYLLTHSQPTVGDTTSLTTPFTIPSTIYAGTHTLSLVADILWTGTLVTLEDRLTYSTTDTAYLLDENTIMDAVDAYKASYRLNLVNNKSEARNQRAIIADIDLYEDDYWVAVRRYDKLTAYLSLLEIYDLLNETLVSTGEIPVYKAITERVDEVESTVGGFDGRISDIEDSISTIEQTAEDAQTAVSNHINATTAHSISQVDGLQSALDGKSPSSHAHAISDVSGLQTALNGKAPSSHTHVKADVTDFAHNHSISDVTNLQTNLTNLENENTRQNTTIDDALAYTGFTNPAGIEVSYNSTTRKVTLTGDVKLYYKGRIIPEFISGWESPAHADVAGVYFLRYNGSGVMFDTTPWYFYCAQIAFAQYKVTGTISVGIRESHGLGDWNWHLGQHNTIGTYLSSGGDLFNHTLNSQTATDRRPDVSATTVNDEDLPSTITALTSKKYCQRYLSGTGTRNLTVEQDDIIANNGSLPYYNQWNGSEWVQTLMSNNQYGAIFVVALPVTSDSGSQQIRYMWVQPQQVGTLTTIQSLTPINLTHGDSSSLVSEFVFIGKVIIRVTGGGWQLHSVEKLTGSRSLQVSSPAGNYLSVVTTDSTLTGEGTASSPLGVNVSSFYNTLSGDVTISLGTFNQPERSNAVSTISSLLITNANFKGATLIPMVTSDHEDLDEHAVERVNFMVENIVDNTSFDIRIFAPDGSWGNYKYKYIITY